MKCQNCGVEIQGQAKFCSKCGSKVEQPPVLKASVTGSTHHDISNIWPEWQIEKQLGRGSYGVVYQAIRRDNNVESHAAIKIISIPSDPSEVDSLRSEGLDMDGTRTYFKGIVDDFVSEIQLMESLKGVQNIVSVEDYKVVEKRDAIGWDIYIRMELLTPFNTYICDKMLTEKEIVKLGIDICTALEICGQRNIIHRDIKPENIFVNDFGYFKLGDFGIARKLENMTGGLSQKGTFNYMAPEVANSNEYDSRVDIYSLGVVLYRLLNNNRLPFLDMDRQLLSPNERKLAVERRIRGEALPVPCNASPAMAALIKCACAYNPNARFSSASEMKQALISVANGNYVFIEDNNSFNVPQMQVGGIANGVVKEPFGGKQVVVQQPEINTFGDDYNKKKSKKRKVTKRKKAKIIVAAVLSSLVALAVALAVVFFSSAAYSVYRNMNCDDFEEALILYNSEVENDFFQESLLDILLKDYVNNVGLMYESGDIDFDIAIAELSALDEMGVDGAKAKIKEITVANDSVNALAKADEYYENGDYENAILEYSKVPESNKNYQEAQNKLIKVYDDYINSIVESASKYISSKNYKQAIQLVNTAYSILPDTVDKVKLDTIKEEGLANYKTEIANEVAELTENEKWSEAFDLIDEAISFDDNEYFRNLKASTESSYVESVTATVQKHLNNEDYTSAKRVAENALTVLPSNADLKELKKEVEDSTPTYLLNVCKPYATSNYIEYPSENNYSFSMGTKTYTNGFALVKNGHDGGYAIFNTDGKHTRLNFLVGHIDGTSMFDANITVFCDGVPAYQIDLSSEALPEKVSIDITGVKQVKFVMTPIGRHYDMSPHYGFANVTVK